MFYGVLWDVLKETGIVYLPFLGILVEYWRTPAVEGPIGPASSRSLRTLEYELFVALFVVVLAAQPAALTAIRSNTLSYTPAPSINNPTPTPVTLRTNDSTFGHSGFLDPDHTVNTPAWWFAVLSFSSGFNHAVIEGLPRSSEVRQAINLARMVTIENPVVRSEVAQFYQDCYVPARSKFLREQPNSASVQAILAAEGLEDTDWIGSHVFRRTSGYYNAYRSTVPIKDWPYRASRDTEYDPAAPPVAGRPYCNEWWEHPTAGLRYKLITTVNVQAAGYAGILVGFGVAMDSEAHLDIVARTALLNRPPNWSNNDLKAQNASTTGWLNKVESAIKSTISGAGVAIAAGITSLTVTVLLQLLPLLQALILLGIYALLPMLLVFSRYSLGVAVSMGITIFSIKFWTVLWFLAQWVDQNLITAMYPDTNQLIESFLLESEHGSKRILLNTATSLMYIGLPVLWTLMIGWAGVKVGRSIDGTATPYGQISSDAGQQGAGLVRRFT